MPGVLNLLQQGDVVPVGFPLGFLAPNQVGEREKGELPAAVAPLLTPGIQVGERSE